MRLIYDILHFLRNVWKWRRILWDDKDFDYGYLYDMLQFKLENMYVNCINGYTENKGEYRYMKIASDLIEIVKDELYVQEAYANFPDDIKPDEDFLTWLNTPNPKRNAAMEVAYKQQEKAKRLLFKIIYEKIDYWWD